MQSVHGQIIRRGQIVEEILEVIMSDAPSNDQCLQFADYVPAGYITESSTFPPTVWAAVPDLTSKQTNNGPESFDSKLNVHLYASHPNISFFVDVIKKMQATTCINIRAIDSIFAPRRCEMEKLLFAVAQFECYSKGESDLLNRRALLRQVLLYLKYCSMIVKQYSWNLSK